MGMGRVFFAERMTIWGTEWLKIPDNNRKEFNTVFIPTVTPTPVIEYNSNARPEECKKALQNLNNWLDAVNCTGRISQGLKMNSGDEWLQIKAASFAQAEVAKSEAESAKIAADDVVNKTFSDRYTKFYTRNIDRFQGARNISGNELSKEDATNTAWEFMKKRGVQIQELFRNPSITKETRKIQIQAWRDEFINEQQITLASRVKIEPIVTDGYISTIEAKNSEATIYEEDEEDNALDDTYDKAREFQQIAITQLDKTKQDYEIAAIQYSDEVIKNQQVGNNPEEHTIIGEKIWNISHDLKDTVATSEGMRDRMDAIPLGWVDVFNMMDESGTSSQFRMVHLPNGDYVLHFPPPENGNYIIDSNGEAKEKEINLLKELIKTPILRRLITMGNGYFDQFQDRLGSQNPWRDISDPEIFKKCAYQSIFLALPDSPLKQSLLAKTSDSAGVTNIITGLRSDPATTESLRREFRSIGLMKQPDGKEFTPTTLLMKI
jgi:hypothetical protein